MQQRKEKIKFRLAARNITHAGMLCVLIPLWELKGLFAYEALEKSPLKTIFLLNRVCGDSRQREIHLV